MELGILVNTDKHLEHVLGLTGAATSKGYEVAIFVMDGGTRLLRDASFIELAGRGGVTMSVCLHSADLHRVETTGLPEEITCGSQFNNAMMTHGADRVIVL